MRLWIDADACPGAIKDVIIRAALKREMTTFFVANKIITLPDSPWLLGVQVPLGPDVVDQYIIGQAQSGDLVVSQDIPLAAELVSRGVVVINPHGVLFTPNNIAERLSHRNFLQEMRDSGLVTGGPKAFGDKEKRDFSNTFDQTLTRLLKNEA
jgi:uncharacterized protein YaiI (UPF0178 family)